MNRPGNFPSRSLIRDRARQPASSRSITRFLAGLCPPGCCLVDGSAQDPDSPAGVLDHRKHVQPRAGQGDRLEEVTGQQDLGLGARKSAHVVELRSGAGSIPASCRISQMVEAATFTPSTSSSPCTLRYPTRDSRGPDGAPGRGSSARCAAGPGCRGRDRWACRRATASRCQRSTVSGRTTRGSLLSTSLGSRCSSAASKARSPGVNHTLSGPSCRCRTESW